MNRGDFFILLITMARFYYYTCRVQVKGCLFLFVIEATVFCCLHPILVLTFLYTLLSKLAELLPNFHKRKEMKKIFMIAALLIGAYTITVAQARERKVPSTKEAQAENPGG